MSEMNVNATSTASVSSYSSYSTSSDKKVSTDAKAVSDAESAGAVYEKSADTKSATYSINKMSADDRAKLVASMKADTESRQSQLAGIVSQMLTGQANTFAKTDDSLWKVLAGGNFTVDPATRAQAQADIAEDGYWGVKQTSQRLFDFASAIAGDDEEMMKKMQDAMQKGFKMAQGTWGRELPSISQETMKAANQLFEDYYASKKTVAAEN